MIPKITVITICKNALNDLERTILSVLNQSLKPYEYIIIDGNSSDGTKDLLNKYRDKVALILSEDDKGISDALNKGIENAKGDYILLVNAGDCLNERCVEELKRQIDGDYDVYRCSTTVVGRNGKNKERFPSLKYPSIPFIFHCCHMGAVIRREAFRIYGGYRTDYLIAMDKELLFRFHRMGATEKRLDLNVGFFYKGGISNYPSKEKYLEELRIQADNSKNRLSRIIFRCYLWVRYTVKKCIIWRKNVCKN